MREKTGPEINESDVSLKKKGFLLSFTRLGGMAQLGLLGLLAGNMLKKMA